MTRALLAALFSTSLATAAPAEEVGRVGVDRIEHPRAFCRSDEIVQLGGLPGTLLVAESQGGKLQEVLAQALIVGGRVTEVRILSGPPVFHNAVRDAMRQYRCASSSTQVRVTQKFSFRLE